jgi:hypothetical protein
MHLAKLTDAWIPEDTLYGVIKFNRTDAGMRAEGMIRPGELGGVSIGYRVLEWEVQDAKGKVVEPDDVKWGDGDLNFVGKI